MDVGTLMLCNEQLKKKKRGGCDKVILCIDERDTTENALQ